MTHGFVCVIHIFKFMSVKSSVSWSGGSEALSWEAWAWEGGASESSGRKQQL